MVNIAFDMGNDSLPVPLLQSSGSIKLEPPQVCTGIGRKIERKKIVATHLSAFDFSAS
jgi:hypothetical protein